MFWYLVLLAAGCVLLYFGAEWLVAGASRIAVELGISKAVIGLTLVAMGTSAPELFVNVIAGSRGETGIALSNVSGSNLTNICVGFGLCGLTGGVLLAWRAFFFDCVMLVLSVAVVLGALLMNVANPQVPFWMVGPMLFLLAVYLLSLYRRAGSGTISLTTEVDEIDVEAAKEPYGRRIFLDLGILAAGILCLYGGGDFVLRGAVGIAEKLKLDPPLIGLTIVAAGTSVPDTIASLIAARRNEHEIAVGNLLGSNISNVLVVLSGTLIASAAGGNPTVLADKTEIPAGILQGSSLIMGDYLMVGVVSLFFVVSARLRGGVRHGVGGFLLLTYLCYMGYRVYIEWPGAAA